MFYLPADGREGFRLTRRAVPDLVISEINLPEISAIELCRMIREDRELWTTPLMFVSESPQKNKNLIELLETGADECLAEFSNPQYIAAKAKWLIKRKYAENNLMQNYEILRRRQLPIAQLIKDTTKLFTNSDIGYKTVSLKESNTQDFEKILSQRVDLGMNMIGALANLLEDQVKVLENWKRSQHERKFVFNQRSAGNLPETNYEYITDNSTNDNLRVN